MRKPREQPPSAPLYLACPYCQRRRFETIEAVNVHIARSHDGEGPQIRLPKYGYRILGKPKIVGYTGRAYKRHPANLGA